MTRRSSVVQTLVELADTLVDDFDVVELLGVSAAGVMLASPDGELRLTASSTRPCEVPMDDADVIVAQAFADLAAIGIIQHQAVLETRRVNEQLTRALESRVVIEQAKGVIAERAGRGPGR